MKTSLIIVILGVVIGISSVTVFSLYHVVISSDEHYEIKITGLEPVYTLNETYSFDYRITGFGDACAKIDVYYPDENGIMIRKTTLPQCAAERNLMPLDIGSYYGPLGNVAIKKPGKYEIEVTYEPLSNPSLITSEGREFIVNDPNQKPSEISYKAHCAYVGAKRLSEYDLEKISNNPNANAPKFLNFTENDLEKVPSLKDVTDVLAAKEFPPNDRGYVTVSLEELRGIQNYLFSKSISKYNDTRESYLSEYHEQENLDGFISSHIVFEGNLYYVNGLSSQPVNPDGEILNIEFEGKFKDQKEEFTEFEREKNPWRRYVELSEEDLEEIEPIKNAIGQIGTWEMSFREANDVGDTIQNSVIDFMNNQSLKQIGPGIENRTPYFIYEGNYYQTEFVIC